MGIFSRKRKAIKEDMSISVGANGLSGLFGASVEHAALENSAFWTCITSLCRTFATLPLHAYKQSGASRRRLDDGLLERLLQHPCPYMTPYLWRWTMAFNFELRGIAMAIKDYTATGAIMSLYPVDPTCMVESWENGQLFWTYTPTQQRFHDSKVFRIINTGIGYTKVLSPLDYAKKDLDIVSSSKRLQASYYDKGTTIGSILTVPKGTPKEVKDILQAKISGEYSGSKNSGKTFVLEDTMKYEPIRLTENDVSKIEAAQSWSVQEVARRFGVPSFFAGDLSKSTFANAEQQGAHLVAYSLAPRAVAWESAFNTLCFNGEYFKFGLNGLMRGDAAARSGFYHSGIMDGWLSPNDVRALEDLDPIPNGDKYMFPLNYTTLDKVGMQAGPYDGQNESNASHQNNASKLIPVEEKRKQDRLFVEATNAVTKSNRSKIERIIRKQLKIEIAKLRELVKAGKSASDIAEEFKTFASDKINHHGEEYADVYKDIMARLYPIVQKAIKTKDKVSQDSMDAYSAKLAYNVGARHGALRAKEVTKAVRGNLTQEELEEELEELEKHWIEVVPADESKEETQRAGNAFNLFLFSQFGLQYMHIVAASDSCEFCNGLDGQVCEVSSVVLAKGTDVTDGEGNTRTIEKNLKHPPWHGHCNCGIAPGR